MWCIIRFHWDFIVFFPIELSLSDLTSLFNKALRYSGRMSYTWCEWLYRNRSEQYFADIQCKHRGIMEVHDKDNSGDQASPINGKIKGLFFMAKNINGEPPPDSPFGSVRLQVPAEILLNETPNLYFTDFYCMCGIIHYVTLVMTKPRSAADDFCRDRLLPLSLDDRENNPFLFRISNQLYVNVAHNFLVEVFYTENIDINYLRNRGAILLSNIPTIGKGHSTPGGIPKNSSCHLCNLPTADGRLPRF